MSILKNLTIRKGLLSDQLEIRNLCKDIWSGHDFLPEVWNHWIINDIGIFIIAELNHEIVGVYHFYTLDSDSWIETLRVKDNYRRQGIAKYLVNDYIERSNQLQFETLRLVTSINNSASLSLFHSFDFNEILYPQYLHFDDNLIDSTTDSKQYVIIDDKEDIFSILKNMKINNNLIPLWWRWWNPNNVTLYECAKNSFAIISKSDPSSFILIQHSKNFGYKDDYQLLFFNISSDNLKNSLSYLKTCFSNLVNKKIFCIPDTNSADLQLLENLGFIKGTKLVVLEKSINSI